MDDPRLPRYMNDEQRLELALGLLDEAYSALCWIGCDRRGLPFIPRDQRPARLQKALERLDKTITALEKHQEEEAK